MQHARSHRRLAAALLVVGLAVPALSVPAPGAGAAADPLGSLAARVEHLRAQAGALPKTTPEAAPLDASASEGSASIADTVGDSAARSDITGASVGVGLEGRLQGFTWVRQFTDPANDAKWFAGGSYVFWDFDVDNDNSSDYYLVLWNTGSGVRGDFRRTSDDSLVCAGNRGWLSPESQYAVWVPVSCLGNVASVRWFGSMVYDLNGTMTFDFVPNIGWNGPVPNDASWKAAAGTAIQTPVTGRNGVPSSGVAAVAMNVTVTEPEGSGFITVFACDTTRPLASNLNYVAGQTVPNLVIAPLSASGRACLYTLAKTHLIADLVGWFPTNPAGFQPLTPTRVFDTRIGTGGVTPNQRVAGDGTLTIQMTGRNGVPAGGVAAVSLNVTVTDPTAGGYLTVYPCGARPLASNLNYVAGQTVPNAVIAPVSPDGKVCFYALGATHLLADVNGWFPVNPAGFQALTPARVFDTRDGTGGVTPNQRVAGDGTLTVQMTGANGVPAGGVAAVSLNVTVTEPTAGGYLTVYPCGTRPLASNLNYVAGQTVPNAVIAPVSPDGRVCFYALGATHLLADVNGWFPVNPAGFQALTPVRLFDTRG